MIIADRLLEVMGVGQTLDLQFTTSLLTISTQLWRVSFSKAVLCNMFAALSGMVISHKSKSRVKGYLRVSARIPCSKIPLEQDSRMALVPILVHLGLMQVGP